MSKKMIEIDGLKGGGQIFRTALTMSLCLNQPVRILNIRGARTKPGLLRQHLTCLRAAQKISNGKVTGDELGSQTVSFYPGKVLPGHYEFATGSAGSTTLVLQTVLIPLALAKGESQLTLSGGTHNGMAPSFDFIDQSFLPLLAKMGIETDVELSAWGFYPAGGGQWHVRIKPTLGWQPLVLNSTGALKRKQAVATSARLPSHVTERELHAVAKKCLWQRDELVGLQVPSSGPGNILSLRLEYEHLTEVIEVVGDRSLSAERVAGRAIVELNKYLKAQVPVGEHLADQLIVPMALGVGGSFRTSAPSKHLLTNIDVVKQFLPVSVQVNPLGEHDWLVEISDRSN